MIRCTDSKQTAALFIFSTKLAKHAVQALNWLVSCTSDGRTARGHFQIHVLSESQFRVSELRTSHGTATTIVAPWSQRMSCACTVGSCCNLRRAASLQCTLSVLATIGLQADRFPMFSIFKLRKQRWSWQCGGTCTY